MDPEREPDERPRSLAEFAAQHGLRYSEEDHFGIPDTHFFLFAAGQKEAVGVCANVVWGDWKGLSIKEADYTFGALSESPLAIVPGVSTYGVATDTASVAVADIEASVPWVRVTNKDELTRLADDVDHIFHVRHDHLEVEFFGAKDFNTAFEVYSRHPEFARQLFDRPMRDAMLAERLGLFYELNGSRVVLSTARLLETAELPELLDATTRFVDRIPGAGLDAGSGRSNHT